MPKMTAIDLIDELRRVPPDTPVIVELYVEATGKGYGATYAVHYTEPVQYGPGKYDPTAPTHAIILTCAKASDDDKGIPE